MTALATALLLLASTQTVEMSVFVGNDAVGSARVTETLLEGGGKKTNTRITLTSGGRTVTVEEETEYEASGAPKRKYTRQSGASGGEVRIATFSGAGARVVIERDGQRTIEIIPIPEGVSIRAASEFWFMTSRPRVGQTDTYFRFDMSQIKWIETTARYEGPEQISVGGKNVRAHRISIKGVAESWLDDNGRPLALQAGALRMVARL